MQRRTFLTGAIASAATAKRFSTIASDSGRPRNVLLVISEQTQHNVCSFAGGPARTPALDQLASQSTNFASACTTTGLCSPSRSCLFTGRWGHRTGLDDHCMTWHSRLNGLEWQHSTLIDWAHDAGARVGYFGKWHLGADGPIRRGATAYPPGGIESKDARLAGKSQPKPDFSATRKYYDPSQTWQEKPQFWATAPNGYEQTPGHQFAAQAARFLSEQPKDKAFFLTLSLTEVHPPYRVPAPYNEMYDPASIILPTSIHDSFEGKPSYQNDVMWPFHDTGHLSTHDWRTIIAYYYGSLGVMDRAVGEVLAAIEEHGFAEDTMVVFTSDHGDMTGAHNRFDKGPYCYEEIMRVPLLIRVPGEDAQRIDRSVSTIDVAATIVEWMGLRSKHSPIDSSSLLPLCRHGEKGRSGPDEIFYRYEWYNGLWFGIRAVRTPSFKYAFNPAGQDELYDLRSDANEMRNLIDDPSLTPTVKQLRQKLLSHLRSISDPEALRLEQFMRAANS